LVYYFTLKVQGGTVTISDSLRHFYVLAKNSLTLKQFCQHIKMLRQ